MSLHTIIRNLIDDDFEIDDASKIPEDMRPEFIRVWLDDATGIAIDEALQSGSNTPDECRTLALYSCGMPADVSKLLQKRFWEGITYLVDKAIEEVKSEHETTARIARESRAEQQAEWQRERYADAKESWA